MPVEIREATAADSETIVDFNCRLAEETEAIELAREVVRRGVQRLFAEPARGRYFVAEAEGKIVGQLMVTYEWSDWRDGDIWWLQSVYVHPEFRRQGVFRALMEHVVSCQQQDPHTVGIRLYVEENNEAAQATYHRVGFRPGGYLVLQKMQTPH